MLRQRDREARDPARAAVDEDRLAGLQLERLLERDQRRQPGERDRREESARFRRFSYDELMARDKASLDIFWLKDKDLEDLDSLPEPDVLAEEIAEDLRTALEQFNALGEDLRDRV